MSASGRPPLDEQLQAAPVQPGVYLFREADGRVLYVGKARNLRNRVQVYRRAGADGRLRMAELLSRAEAVEFRVTDNEKEALLLESRLAKRYQPPLNVHLKDDKSFLLVQIDTRHRWPRIGLAREHRHGKGEFYGPYGSAGAARRAKRLLQKAFGLRDCSDHTLMNRSRPCLKYDVGLCSAPCVGVVSEEEYAAGLEGAREVLRGEVRDCIRSEQRRMEEASAALQYETALRARDRMRALEALAAPQKVRLSAERDFDVVGLDERGHFAVLEYREGEWIGSSQGLVPVRDAPAAMVGELLSALYVSGEREIPPEILVGALPEEAEALEALLRERLSRRVAIRAPRRGEKRALVRMAESNARAQRGARASAPWPTVAERLAEITRYAPPAVVDCIDVSHMQGKERVAARVRFVEGRPDRAQYRRYLVGGGVGNDDFAAMREVMSRFLAKIDVEGIPDLIVLDGGRLQLDAGRRAASEAGVDPPLAALAKARRGRGPVAAEERLFLPDRSDPAVLAPGSPERLFLERIRDEAHRFAISYHRNRRHSLRLILEQVPGIGQKRRKAILDAFAGDLARVRDAAPDDLAAVEGMTPELAEAVQRHLAEVLP